MLLHHKYQLYEVNPLYTKRRRTFGTKPDKTDPRDAKIIAEVLTRKLAELPKITKHDLSSHMLMVRKTVWLYEQMTDETTAIQNQLRQLRREEKLSMDSQEKALLQRIIEERRQIKKQIEKSKRVWKKELAVLLEKQGKNLTTMKGIDTVLAAKIVAHSGGIERFKNIDDFVQYSGIAPKEVSSGKSKRHKKATIGNRKLNHALYLAGMLQLRWSSKAKEYFDKKVKEGKTKKHTLKCLMRRTACIIYGMLKSGNDYQERSKKDGSE